MNTPRKETRFIAIHRAEAGFDQYHAWVDLDGTVHQMMDWDAHGAAVRNFNSVAVSVAARGDFCDADARKAKYGTPTPAQWEAVASLVATLVNERYPGARVVGHTELGPGATAYVEKLKAETSCPGTRFDMDKFRQAVKERLSALSSSTNV